MSLKRLTATFLLLLGLAVPALADPAIPALTGRVMDLAHILDDRTVHALTAQLADHEASTSNQVVVVTLPDLQNYTIEQWGRALLNGWGIGQRDKNNGVVLVVAPNDRRLRIEVGYGLETVLSNAAASKIIETEIVPRFKREDMRGGVTAGVNAILQTITGTYRPTPLVERSSGSEPKDLTSFAPFVIIPLFFIITVVVNIARGGSSSRRGRTYGNGYNSYNDGTYWNNRDRGPRSSGFSSGGGGGFSGGGGGSSGGGGASGRW